MKKVIELRHPYLRVLEGANSAEKQDRTTCEANKIMKKKESKNERSHNPSSHALQIEPLMQKYD